MPGPYKRLETKLVHAGEPRPRIDGAVEMPIFQSATFEYRGEARYDDVRYLRLNNTPNHLALHAKLADLEGAEAALVTASGMAAITTTLLTVLSAGRPPAGAELPVRRHARLRDPRVRGPGPLAWTSSTPTGPRLARAAQTQHARHLRRGDDQPAARGGGPASSRRSSPARTG